MQAHVSLKEWNLKTNINASMLERKECNNSNAMFEANTGLNTEAGAS